MWFNIPRLVLAGLSGGSGKTIVSLGLIRALKREGKRVKPFKKGPDYIDASWLGKAAGHEATNLDPFFLDEDLIVSLFREASLSFDFAFIEGNRGLFDGLDVEGSCSTSHLARSLSCPIVVVVDCTKVTRTVAALLSGLESFESHIHLAGVIFNRVGGRRHRDILTRCVERYTDIPVLGAIPKLEEDPIPERHMGLISDKEWKSERSLNLLADVISQHVELDLLQKIAQSAPSIREERPLPWPFLDDRVRVRIGVVKDSSLWFYYPENIEALRRCGAEIVEISLLEDTSGFPNIHGLYLGGGFPETLAEQLSENKRTRDSIRALSCAGMPIYAECGGLMYLCRHILFQGKIYPMADIFPFTVEVCNKPQGHGYTRVKVVAPNPFFKQGELFCGHEFHYSRCTGIEEVKEKGGRLCLYMERGIGLDQKGDGILIYNTFASYNHIHALHIPSWARNFVMAASHFKDSLKKNRVVSCLTALY